jgi:hypothetical protein
MRMDAKKLWRLMILPLLVVLVSTSFAQVPALLPFRIDGEEATFPAAPALHSFVLGQSDGKWLLLGGRTNGIHSFSPLPVNNFPPAMANHWAWVVDPEAGQSWSVDLYDSSLTSLSAVADSLSASNMQAFQNGNTLYVIGGYGYNRSTATMQTYATLTAIDLPGMVTAVMSGIPANVVGHIRQSLPDDRLRVTGGELEKLGDFFFLVFGQRFDGLYDPSDANNDQQYTEEVRIFKIVDDGTNPPSISDYSTIPAPPAEPGDPLPNQFHRRDLNVMPAIRANGRPGISVYGGVFTTQFMPYFNPIYIDGVEGSNTAAIDRSFNQYMNQYDCARMGIFDTVRGAMYTTFFGGISLGVYAPDSGSSAARVSPEADVRVPYADLIQMETLQDASGFILDSNIPFIDQITTVALRADGTSQQCVLAQHSTGSLSPLQMPERLGTNARFIVDPAAPAFENGVINLRTLTGRTLVGYLYGGMRTNDENPTGTGQSFASNRLFKIYVTPAPTACIAVPRVIESSGATR